ncbi:hypothetical protein H0H93_001754 [Arthromyces matolae]|nr:hypothetical protein H0H93_001754 [Arthromyces matolae]
MVHLLTVVNAAPFPSHNELASPELPSSFTDFLFSDGMLWQPQGETSNTYNEPEDDTSNVSYINKASTTGGFTNTAFTKSPTITKPLSQSATADTAQYRVDEQDFSVKDAKTLITRMLNDDLEPTQYPWNQNGEWSDKVLRTAICSIYKWRNNVVTKMRSKKDTQTEDIGGEGTDPSRRQKTWMSMPQKTTAQLDEMNRPELNSEMDSLWDWAVKQKCAVADTKRVSVQAELSRLDTDSKHRMSDKKLVTLLIASIPPYDPAIGMSRMPWRRGTGTFRWNDPDDVKKVLSHIWAVYRKNTPIADPKEENEKKDEFLKNGPMKKVRAEMDKAWMWWIKRRDIMGKSKRKIRANVDKQKRARGAQTKA